VLRVRQVAVEVKKKIAEGNRGRHQAIGTRQQEEKNN
jgi:hypothetical protein